MNIIFVGIKLQFYRLLIRIVCLFVFNKRQTAKPIFQLKSHDPRKGSRPKILKKLHCANLIEKKF